MSYSIAIVGATGLVGRTMISVLEERRFPVGRLKLLASPRSAGVQLMFDSNPVTVEPLTDNSFDDVDIALFSAGGEVSRQFCPVAARAGAVCIDNSSAWRMDLRVPLIVPEVNPERLSDHNGIIANPNCSTIQLVAVLAPLHRQFGIERVVVSTYQSISGAGQSAVDQLLTELKGGTPASPKFSRTAAFNTMFHSFPDDSDQTEEEEKMMRETRKIMETSALRMSVTCVRIPTTGAHGESVNIEFVSAPTVQEVREVLNAAANVEVIDDPANDLYPTILDAEGRDDVLVGRIRRDRSHPSGINLWIVADNLRKGAATNAVQIAELFMGNRELLHAHQWPEEVEAD